MITKVFKVWKCGAGEGWSRTDCVKNEKSVAKSKEGEEFPTNHKKKEA